MKVSILSRFVDGPYGGGNQFLKALVSYLQERGKYETDPLRADIVLVNSKDMLEYVPELVEKHKKTIVHRVDGVFGVYRGQAHLHLDHQVYYFLKNFANGVIYQSNWSKVCHKQNGAPTHSNETVIYNAPNPNIFNRKPSNNDLHANKVKIVTTSWSPNVRKGFGTLQFLDQNLDFEKYEYIFVGQSPVKFKNIKMLEPLPSEKLAQVIKSCDIFITATENDTCSNSLIEALSCGLPAIGLQSGGTPEIIREGGQIFNNNEELLTSIDEVATNLDMYKNNIFVESLEDIGRKYYNFMRRCHDIKHLHR